MLGLHVHVNVIDSLIGKLMITERIRGYDELILVKSSQVVMQGLVSYPPHPIPFSAHI